MSRWSVEIRTVTELNYIQNLLQFMNFVYKYWWTVVLALVLVFSIAQYDCYSDAHICKDHL